MPTKPTHPQKEIDKAVKRYLEGEDVNTLARDYKMSRAGMYIWIRKARENAATAHRSAEIGPKGVESEARISKDLRLKACESEVRALKQKLFELMLETGKL